MTIERLIELKTRLEDGSHESVIEVINALLDDMIEDAKRELAMIDASVEEMD